MTCASVPSSSVLVKETGRFSDRPDARGGFHQGLVAVGIVGGRENICVFFAAMLDDGALVEGADGVSRGFLCRFPCALALADVDSGAPSPLRGKPAVRFVQAPSQPPGALS